MNTGLLVSRSSRNTITLISSRTSRWVGSVERKGSVRNIYTIFSFYTERSETNFVTTMLEITSFVDLTRIVRIVRMRKKMENTSYFNVSLPN
jgi:hypothetical protein